MSYQDDDQENDEMFTHDRDAAILWARSVLADPDALILDTETTGLDGASEICQVALVNIQGECVYESLVKPWCVIPKDVIKIHGITNEMVQDAPRFSEIHPAISQLMAGRKIVIYNADFDTRMLIQSGRYYGGLPLIGAQYQCAMEMYAQYYGEWNSYRGSYRWQRLQGGDHSAKGDCLAALERVKEMAKARLSTEKEKETE